ncbi:hypothetical protein DBV15_06775 [Temnothorax longispinosus]|uniref:Uncharacterized protein n=1 Tax=Temnothorax longispinosus TaxID=300112 RepID=A0A4V3SC06_9HYME|nr:hypothetical protein DBV15_06775 [Temnothorax longispinosus]
MLEIVVLVIVAVAVVVIVDLDPCYESKSEICLANDWARARQRRRHMPGLCVQLLYRPWGLGRWVTRFVRRARLVHTRDSAPLPSVRIPSAIRGVTASFGWVRAKETDENRAGMRETRREEFVKSLPRSLHPVISHQLAAPYSYYDSFKYFPLIDHDLDALLINNKLIASTFESKIGGDIVSDGSESKNKETVTIDNILAAVNPVNGADRQPIPPGPRSHERGSSRDRGVKGSAFEGHGEEGQRGRLTSRREERKRKRGGRARERVADGRPGMYPPTTTTQRASSAYRSTRVACVFGRRGAPPHRRAVVEKRARTREWQRRRRRRRRRQNDVKDAREWPAEAEDKERDREEEQGEANGRSKQVEAVERGRVSVSAVHLVHSCSLRRAAGPRASGRRREIATDADGRTDRRTRREGVAGIREGRKTKGARAREERTPQRGTPLWTDGRHRHCPHPRYLLPPHPPLPPRRHPRSASFVALRFSLALPAARASNVFLPSLLRDYERSVIRAASSLASNLLDWARYGRYRGHQLTYFRRRNLITRTREQARTSESMIQRDDSGSRANFGECTSHASRAKTADAIDIGFEARLRDDSFDFLPRVKIKKTVREEKSTYCIEGKRENSKEFQSLLSPRSFSNLRAVALNSCKYLSNVRLTGVYTKGKNGGNCKERGKCETKEGRERAEEKKNTNTAPRPKLRSRSSFKETPLFEESRHLAGSDYSEVFVREGPETEKARERKREGMPSTWKSEHLLNSLSRAERPSQKSIDSRRRKKGNRNFRKTLMSVSFFRNRSMPTGTKKYPRARRQKNDGGKERGRRRVRHKGREREREKREKGDLAGPRRESVCEEPEHRGSGTRDWGPPGFEERRNVESTTQRGEPSRGIKSRSGLYCTLSSRGLARRVPSTITRCGRRPVMRD